MRKVKGLMNGLCECDLCAEIDMMDSDDPNAPKEYRTASYMLPDGLSTKTLKRMFCDLFFKRIEITLTDNERICSINILEHEYWTSEKRE